MRQHYEYKCPRCDYKQIISLDLPAGDKPKYAPTHADKDKHHSNRSFEMELISGG